MKNLILLLLFSASSMSHAVGLHEFSIKNIGISEGSYTVFVDTNENHTLSECSRKNSFRYVINKENSLYKEIYSGLLAAKMSASKVEIAFTEEAQDCLYNSPQILSIRIK